MSQRTLKKALLRFKGIDFKELKTLFHVKKKAIKGMVSIIGDYKFVLIPGRSTKNYDRKTE